MICLGAGKCFDSSNFCSSCLFVTLHVVCLSLWLFVDGRSPATPTLNTTNFGIVFVAAAIAATHYILTLLLCCKKLPILLQALSKFHKIPNQTLQSRQLPQLYIFEIVFLSTVVLVVAY